MMDKANVTELLRAYRKGDAAAGGKLFGIIYRELHTVARRHLRRNRRGETLNTTGLVHEVYLKLFGTIPMCWKDRAHFFAVAAKAMRQILVDHARRMQAVKRGGQFQKTALSTSMIRVEGAELDVDMLDLDVALTRLNDYNPRLTQVVELRFFAGLSVEEVANLLEVSSRTVERDWYKARGILYRQLVTAE